MKRNAKGHFVKSGRKSRSRKRSVAVVHQARSAPAKRRKRRASGGGGGRRRRSGGSSGAGGVTLAKLAITGGVMGFLLGDKTSSTPEFAATIKNTLKSIPGGKTFSPIAMAGGVALLANHFVWRNPWLRAAGIIGVASAAIQIGQQNTSFKFLGDTGDVHGADEFVADVG